MKIRFWKILNTGITVILFFTLILTIGLVIVTKASGGEPTVLGYQLKTVLSGSMEPGIKTGSIISVIPIDDPSKLEKGEVITYINSDNNLVTHRVMEKIGSGNQLQFVTKGDNNEDADSTPVLAQNVMAKYTGFTIPYVGYVANFANSKNGMATMLIVPGLLLLLYSGYSIWSVLRELDPKEKTKSVSS